MTLRLQMKIWTSSWLLAFLSFISIMSSDTMHLQRKHNHYAGMREKQLFTLHSLYIQVDDFFSFFVFFLQSTNKK